MGTQSDVKKFLKKPGSLEGMFPAIFNDNCEHG